MFTQWAAALTAESAVLGQRRDADDWVAQAVGSSVGNPVATAITRRAAALLACDADLELLETIAADLDTAGAVYQAERTRAYATPRPR